MTRGDSPMELERITVARWEDWCGKSLEHLVLRERLYGIIAEGVIFVTLEPHPFAVTYRIECDAAWQVKNAHARVIGVDAAIDVTSDGAGHWRDGAGLALPHFDGAIDVDLSITPFTNTLPIRRLNLSEGQHADIEVIYMHFPDLIVTTDRQRYTCLKRGQYRYESLDSEFTRDIDVDADGLILTYPGLFRRVL